MSDKGLCPTNLTDFVVAPLAQRLTISNRSIASRLAVIGPDQRITPMETLKAITINAAYHYSGEKSTGLPEVASLRIW